MVIRIVMEPKMFVDYTRPRGMLSSDMGAHALFYYWALATSKLHHEDTHLILEDDPWWTPPNFKRMYLNVAQIYGVDPNTMANYWDEVERQLTYLNTLRPEGEQFSSLPPHLKRPR